jgi:hypothetical protein
MIPAELFVCRIVVAVDVDRLDLYHRAPGAGYHVNVEALSEPT